jgi:hypothetical protein
MKNITLSCLKQNSYTPTDFKIGEKVRLYITYWGSCTEIDVREGTVLDPNYVKKSYWKEGEPSLNILVEKAGRVRDRKPKLTKTSYTRSYIYPSIGLVEKLEK